MKLGLHAYSFVLASGLRETYKPKRETMTAEQMLDKAVQMKFTALQLGRNSLTKWDMVTLVNLGHAAKEQGVVLHLSTNTLLGKLPAKASELGEAPPRKMNDGMGEHLADMIRYAYTLGAEQVTVGLSHLQGNVQQRQRTLEQLLQELDVAIKTAERYSIMLALENGRHTAAADLAAVVQAAQSDWVGVCFDTGNPLTVPEDPIDAAKQLAPYCKSVHLKDFAVFRTSNGAMLINSPLGEGVIDAAEVVSALKLKNPETPVFLQTTAERVPVPVLSDEFLQRYPRITARALAALLRLGESEYNANELRFPYERVNPVEKEVLKWEEERIKRSRTKYFGPQSLTLPLGEEEEAEEDGDKDT